MAKYDPLRDYLASKGSLVVMAFDEIATLVGGLPASAFRRREWWANHVGTANVQARAWIAAGFVVDDVNLIRREVRFARPSGQ